MSNKLRDYTKRAVFYSKEDPELLTNLIELYGFPVNLDADVDAVSLTVPNGTLLVDIISALPTSVDMGTPKGIPYTLDIQWGVDTTPTYVPTTSGEYVLSGTLLHAPAFITNTGEKVAKATITVAEAPSADALFTAYSIPNQVGETVIDLENGDVTVTLPYGSTVTEIVPTFTLSEGASAKIGDVVQISGETSVDYTSPVEYVVTAEDGTTTKTWTVAVLVARNTATDFLAYSIPNQVGETVIGEQTINLTMPKDTDVTALVATFTLSEGALAVVGEVPQVSETTPNDFTGNVTYTVTAEDGVVSKVWVVSVEVATE